MFTTALSLGLLLGTLACRSSGDTPTDSLDPQDTQDTAPLWDPAYQQVIEVMQSELEQSTAGAASVAVWSRGEVVFTGAVGREHPIDGGEVNAQTRFAIGSTTKVLTATLLLRDVEAGVVSLDDTLAQALPELSMVKEPGGTEKVLVRHLLSHQGGFNDWVPWDGPTADHELGGTAYTSWAEQAYFMAEPGSFWNYSNPNFSLAGLISEQQGESWPDRLQAEVLEPLGMSGCTPRGVDLVGAEHVAVGWGPQVEGGVGVVEPDTFDPAFARPAGMVWCTPSDMVRFGGFLMEGRQQVLADASPLHTSQVDTQTFNDLVHYGFGLFLIPGLATEQGWHATPVWQHGGNTLGHTSIFYVLPEQQVVVSILSSGYGTDFSGTLVAALEAADALPQAQEMVEREMDPARLVLHVGRYMDENNLGELIVTESEGTLSVELPLLDSIGMSYQQELVQAGSDLFYLQADGDWYDLTFIQDQGQGDSQWVRNRNFVATRAPAGLLGQVGSSAPPELHWVPELVPLLGP